MTGVAILAVDAEELTINYLLTISDITDKVVDRIATDRDAKPGFPAISLHRFGGTSRAHGWIDRPVLHIDVRGETRESAYDVIALVRAALLPDVVAGVYDEGVVTDSAEIVGPNYMPDPENGRPRWFMQLQLVTHPLVGAGSPTAT